MKNIFHELYQIAPSRSLHSMDAQIKLLLGYKGLHSGDEVNWGYFGDGTTKSDMEDLIGDLR